MGWRRFNELPRLWSIEADDVDGASLRKEKRFEVDAVDNAG